MRFSLFFHHSFLVTLLALSALSTSAVAFSLSKSSSHRRSTTTLYVSSSSFWSSSSSFESPSLWSARNPAAGRNRHNCYYRLLGVHLDDDGAAIKRAFRQRVKEFHPDANPHVDTTAQFQMINRAYEVLSDPKQRQKYNTRMNYKYTEDTPHFIVSDFEDNSIRQEREHQFRNSRNERNGGWQVNRDGRMFLADDDNSGISFRVSGCE
mmetsp:Transcript_26101/g.45981  ORF Transcript_26101/g.45981 Transcript_26101/m.45981 type:complete len:208 (-) Transcript_26101:163-786(-)